MAPEDIAVIILAGGSGKRVQHVYPDLPKPLIPVAGRAFLDWICCYWARQGVRRMIISLGYLAEVALRHLALSPCPDVEIITLREERPMGTGGATRMAAQLPNCTDPFVVVNGDSLALGPLAGVWSLLAEEAVDGVLVGVEVKDASRYGSLHFRADGRLVGFREKQPGPGWINAGVYFLKRRLLPLFPEFVPMSLEFDLFPALLRAGASLRAHLMDGDFLDIGAPEDLQRADAFIRSHRAELVSGTQLR